MNPWIPAAITVAAAIATCALAAYSIGKARDAEADQNQANAIYREAVDRDMASMVRWVQVRRTWAACQLAWSVAECPGVHEAQVTLWAGGRKVLVGVGNPVIVSAISALVEEHGLATTTKEDA